MLNSEQSRRRFVELSLTLLSVSMVGCRRRAETEPLPAPQLGTARTNAVAKITENVEGRFYVTRSCIDCELCRETAPANFKRNEKEGYCFVYKQPGSNAELALCREATEGCPVEAIVDTQKPK